MRIATTASSPSACRKLLHVPRYCTRSGSGSSGWTLGSAACPALMRRLRLRQGPRPTLAGEMPERSCSCQPPLHQHTQMRPSRSPRAFCLPDRAAYSGPQARPCDALRLSDLRSASWFHGWSAWQLWQSTYSTRRRSISDTQPHA
ncbi:hypothetical protein L1887_58102 [Cichorium endivia]|nr:hypothetical protein L1887_58102 [Cichorium endivia]